MSDIELQAENYELQTAERQAINEAEDDTLTDPFWAFVDKLVPFEPDPNEPF